MSEARLSEPNLSILVNKMSKVVNYIMLFHLVAVVEIRAKSGTDTIRRANEVPNCSSGPGKG